MARRASTWLAIASVSLALLSTACTRTDATGPSDIPAASLEQQGSNT